MSCKKLKEIFDVTSAHSACFSTSTVAEENGKKFVIDNRSGRAICKVKVDGCLIKGDKTKKCDYFFAIDEPAKYFLVELKGGDVKTAVDQLVTTYDYMSRSIGARPDQYKGVLVTSELPSATNLKLRKLQAIALRDKKLVIRSGSRVVTEII